MRPYLSPHERQPIVPKSLNYGDNPDNLGKYIRDETVDMCHIDQPFNSKRRKRIPHR